MVMIKIGNMLVYESTRRKGKRNFLRAFTLIELMVVVIIIGILAAFAIPQYTKTIERSHQSEAITNLGIIRGAQLRYFAEYNTYTDISSRLDIDFSSSAKYFAYDVTGASSTRVGRATRNSTENNNYGPYTIAISEAGVITITGAGGSYDNPPR